MANCHSSALSAAPPALNYLYPAGTQRGTTIEVTAGGTFERWPVKVWTSSTSLNATAGKDKGKLSVAVAADAVPGVHWLRLHDEQGASTPRPFIVGTLADLREKEPNDELANAQAVASAVVVNGRLEKNGDVDTFAVKLQKGQTLVASTDAHRSLRSPMDGVLQVVSPAGFVLEQSNDWHGLDPQVNFAVPTDGTYFVRLFAFPAVPDSGIRLSGGESLVYRLTLTTGAFADFASPLAVQRRPDAKVSVHGWNIPAELKSLPITATEESAAVIHPALANPLVVRVEDHSCHDDLAGDRPGPHEPPFSITSRLAKPAEIDGFPIVGKKGQSLAVRVESREWGLPVNPVVRVLDAAGKQLAAAEPARINTDVELAFNPPADGTYRVEVRDLYGDGGARFVYRLRVAPPEAGFDLTVAGDRFALAPGTPLELPVTIVRRGGFAGPIEVVARGLPAGVTGTEIKPAGKSDGKSITLRLATDKPGPSGPFRIVGKGKDLPERTARATLADFDTTTSDLWLAVGGQVPPPPPKKKR